MNGSKLHQCKVVDIQYGKILLIGEAPLRQTWKKQFFFTLKFLEYGFGGKKTRKFRQI